MKYDSKYLCDTLGIDPGGVESIEEAQTDSGPVYHITLAARAARCPACGGTRCKSKGHTVRRLSHSLFVDRDATFIVRQKRMKCADCERTFVLQSELSRPRGRVSRATERPILSELMDPSATFKSVARRARTTPTTVMNVFDRYCSAPRKALPRILCIDECYGKGQFNEPYCLVLLDFETKKVVDVLEGRDSARFSKYLSSIPESERAPVDFVCIDMWEPYLAAAERWLPNAIVCVDSFHVMESLVRAVDRVRCRVMRGWAGGSDEHYLLKKFDHLIYSARVSPWGKKIKVDKFHGWRSAYELRERLLRIDPQLRIAFDFYHSYQRFNSSDLTPEYAAKRLDELRKDATAASVPELASFQSTLAHWREWIANSFVRVNGRRISNGPIEGTNNQLKKVMRVADGVTSFPRFRARIMYVCNKEISMSPSKSTKGTGKKRGKYKKGT